VTGRPTPTSTPTNHRLQQATWAGTAAFAVTATAATANEGARAIALATALALFAVGIVAFLTAYVIAVGRSRTDAIGIGGLYFLAGERTAPATVRRSFLASLAMQTAVAFATAAARPYTTLAFGILVPTYGIGLAGLWGARHGTFEARTGEQRPEVG
jgi:hypothetical protein